MNPPLCHRPVKLAWLLLPLSIALTSCGGSSSNDDGVDTDGSTGQGGGNTPVETPVEVVLSFADVTSDVGVSLFHANRFGSNPTMPSMFSGGVATEDYDNDGDFDFYLIGGESSTNRLYQNQGNGQFIDVAAAAGVDIKGVKGSGPMFADLDGDGHLDLFIGAVDHNPVFIFLNNGDGTFTDVTAQSGLTVTAPNTVSATVGDIDFDGDVDLFLSHWGHELATGDSLEIIWRNDSTQGSIRFSDISNTMGLNDAYHNQFKTEQNPNAEEDSSFVPSLSDIDGDGDFDLLLVSDYGLTKLYRNDNGTFNQITTDSLIDQFGMGSAVADIDNDGDMDWYVTSIAEKEYDGEDKNPTAGYQGNTLYLNDGTGLFSNASQSRNVADGGWGWGACIADFNNDGLPDIYHVNGWGQNGQLFAMFQDDESRLFINNGDNTFTDRAGEFGVNDAEQGRGLSCSDLDNDGDIDIVISNNQGPAKYYRNELTEGHSYLKLILRGTAPNTSAIGSRVVVNNNAGLVQTKELRLDNNFVSQNAFELHFGFGQHSAPVDITVLWPDGTSRDFTAVSVNQTFTINQ